MLRLQTLFLEEQKHVVNGGACLKCELPDSLPSCLALLKTPVLCQRPLMAPKHKWVAYVSKRKTWLPKKKWKYHWFRECFFILCNSVVFQHNLTFPWHNRSGSIVMRVNEGSVTEVRGLPPTSPPSSAVADTVKAKGLKLKVHLTAAQWETRWAL